MTAEARPLVLQRAVGGGALIGRNHPGAVDFRAEVTGGGRPTVRVVATPDSAEDHHAPQPSGPKSTAVAGQRPTPWTSSP